MTPKVPPVPLLGSEIYENLPPRTTDLFGWNASESVFAELIAELQPKTIIEVGTWKGASALNMAELTRDLNTRIYSIDTWIGGDGHIFSDFADAQPVQRDSHGWPGVYYQFLHNVKALGFADRITPVPFSSIHGFWLLEAHGITADLIYIDAGHHYLDVILDLNAWHTRLAPGGIIFGDDYDMTGVRTAVEHFHQAHAADYSLSIAGKKWILRPTGGTSGATNASRPYIDVNTTPKQP